MTYVIQYSDGAYNQGFGWPVRFCEATIYTSLKEAEEAVEDLPPDAKIIALDPEEPEYQI